jgi:hypothetical protein
MCGRHSWALPYDKVLVDLCLWTSDIEGAHPNCD